MYNNPIIKEYVESHQYDLDNYKPVKNDRVAAIIETRNIPQLEWVINNIKYHTNWDVMLFHFDNSVDHIDCQKVKLPYKIDYPKYNELLKDTFFWESFDQENILIFQSDSFMLKGGIDSYIGYDYIGAPWHWSYDPNFKDRRYKDLSIFKKGGNGGFSLRKKSKMIQILDETTMHTAHINLNEDMFFAKFLEEDIDLEIKKRFCVETIFFEDPMAVHAPHKMFNDEQLKKILNL